MLPRRRGGNVVFFIGWEKKIKKRKKTVRSTDMWQRKRRCKAIPTCVARLRKGNPLGSMGYFVVFFFTGKKILLKYNSNVIGKLKLSGYLEEHACNHKCMERDAGGKITIRDGWTTKGCVICFG